MSSGQANGKSRFGGSGKNRTAAPWVQSKKWVYPALIKSGKFETREDVDQYFGGAKIVCLECGVTRKSLVAHVKIHGLNARQYKEKYNIPVSRPLYGTETLKARSDVMKALWADGESFEEVRKNAPENMKKACKIGTEKALEKGYAFKLKIFKGICAQCGIETEGFPSAKFRKRKFCSLKCNADYNWSHKVFKRSKPKENITAP